MKRNSLDISCAQCGKIVRRKLSRVLRYKNAFCCYLCQGKWISAHQRGSKNGRWRGGKSMSSGYVLSYVRDDSPFLKMRCHGNYVLEHRLVMAHHLGRCFEPWEVVHHINGVKTDNRIENLKLLGGHEEHNTMMNKFIIQLQKERDTLRQMVTEFCAERVKSTP